MFLSRSYVYVKISWYKRVILYNLSNIILHNINIILFNHNHSFYEYSKVKCDKTFIDVKAL